MWERAPDSGLPKVTATPATVRCCQASIGGGHADARTQIFISPAKLVRTNSVGSCIARTSVLHPRRTFDRIHRQRCILLACRYQYDLSSTCYYRMRRKNQVCRSRAAPAEAHELAFVLSLPACSVDCSSSCCGLCRMLPCSHHTPGYPASNHLPRYARR